MSELRIGLERVQESCFDPMRGAQIGLVMNQASVDRSFRYSYDVLAAEGGAKIRAIFSPQHGLWGEEQANMIETPHGHTRLPIEVPVFSLYSETRRPAPKMLEGLDALVIDLQDVGTRIYTYIWTITHCLEECAARRLPVVLLDRPNPLGGGVVEGPVLDPAFQSFVGRAPIPMRHGLTLGELSSRLNRSMGIHADLTVIECTGLDKNSLWPDLKRDWIMTSPNMQRWETVVVYPGQVLLEGANLSEGRGTTLPFEFCGAPWIDPFRLADVLNEQQLPGVSFRPVKFRPTFDKWAGQSCGGVAFQVTDVHAFRSYSATLHLFAAVKSLYPRDFDWLPPPYEYERIKPPIDILSGSSALREWLASESAGLVPPMELIGDRSAQAWARESE
ncbi:hypothetical protein Pan44_35150 [Caulifigura coniformis]|uniref:DUF1343 domain-containing protein n=1 Tax=Caulifigura coniformis TaxID=2527983 RepID=A0A517SH85_9PLAN|nr:DUF1343 domain-containing protein [Caulifigura coniformis]QDT55472.1 hypothetical protein Pan44_35150 [Caulifigura coniformis]